MTKIEEFEKRIKEAENPKELIRGIIYKYTNKINGKCYIGQTIHERKRRRDFLYGKKYSGPKINNARKKYGIENFDYEILSRKIYLNEEVSKNDLDLLELYYIAEYDSLNNGYNNNEGGGSMIGYRATDETKSKQSKALKGRIFSEEHRRKIREYHTGKPLSKEHKLKISEANKGKHSNRKGIPLSEEHKRKIGSTLKGRPSSLKGTTLSEEHKKRLSEIKKGENNSFFGKHHSEEAKRKMSEAKKGKKASEETKRKLSEINKGENNSFYGKHHSMESIIKMSIPIVQIKKDTNEIIKEWLSATEANKATNIKGISECCRGRRKTAGGYKWQYKDCPIEFKPKEKKVKKTFLQINIDNNEIIKEWETATEASRNLKISLSSISQCCNGMRKMAGGYKWECLIK